MFPVSSNVSLFSGWVRTNKQQTPLSSYWDAFATKKIWWHYDVFSIFLNDATVVLLHRHWHCTVLHILGEGWWMVRRGTVTRWPDEKSFMIEPTMGLKYALSIPSPLFVIRLNEESCSCMPGPGPGAYLWKGNRFIKLKHKAWVWDLRVPITPSPSPSYYELNLSSVQYSQLNRVPLSTICRYLRRIKMFMLH